MDTDRLIGRFTSLAFALLGEETRNAMALLGTPDVGSITRAHVI